MSEPGRLILVELHVPSLTPRQKGLCFRRKCLFNCSRFDGNPALEPPAGEYFIIGELNTESIGIPTCPLYGRIIGKTHLADGELMLKAWVSLDPHVQTMNGKADQPYFDMKLGHGSYNVGLGIIRRNNWKAEEA